MRTGLVHLSFSFKMFTVAYSNDLFYGSLTIKWLLKFSDGIDELDFLKKSWLLIWARVSRFNGSFTRIFEIKSFKDDEIESSDGNLSS